MLDKLKAYLTPAESIDAGQAEDFRLTHPEGSYTVLDVRQPSEYEQSHIPGSKLIPLPNLSDRLDELDHHKPVVVY